MKTTITISANNSVKGVNWIAYDRVNIKDSNLVWSLKQLIKDCADLEFEEYQENYGTDYITEISW